MHITWKHLSVHIDVEFQGGKFVIRNVPHTVWSGTGCSCTATVEDTMHEIYVHMLKNNITVMDYKDWRGQDGNGPYKV
jgi:hypothetical protein